MKTIEQLKGEVATIELEVLPLIKSSNSRNITSKEKRCLSKLQSQLDALSYHIRLAIEYGNRLEDIITKELSETRAAIHIRLNATIAPQFQKIDKNGKQINPFKAEIAELRRKEKLLENILID